MAVGTTFEDASEFCQLLEGRIQVAARNSSSSITLSGDEDAVIEAVAVFKDEGKFARQLKVDTAYHSQHVLPCAEAYLTAMERCGTEETTPNGTKWYSSVHQGKVFALGATVEPQYWVDNMTSPVLFGPAVAEAWTDSGPFDLVLEAGPHPVLKTPFLDTVEEIKLLGLYGPISDQDPSLLTNLQPLYPRQPDPHGSSTTFQSTHLTAHDDS